MKTRLRHLWVGSYDEAGLYEQCLVAVLRQNERVKYAPLRGTPHASCLRWILDEALGPEWLKEAEELRRGSRKPWRVDLVVGPYGSFTFKMRVLRDKIFVDAPVVGSIHISKFGELSSRFSLWLGDIPMLLARLEKLFGSSDENPIIDAYEPNGDSFQEADDN